MKRDGSGFMTQREKEWVVKIQLLQLQGSDPENDDYYYLVRPNFCLFHLSRSKLSYFPLQTSSPNSLAPVQNYVKRKAMKESAESASFSLALPQVSREEKNYQSVLFNRFFH